MEGGCRYMPGRPWVNARKHRHTQGADRDGGAAQTHTEAGTHFSLPIPLAPPPPKYTGTPGNAAQGEERWLAVGYKAVAHVHAEPWPRNPDAI